MNKVTVTIYGREYTLLGENSEKEIKRIAAYVDGKMRDIAKMSGENGPTGLAVLTALNLSEDLFSARAAQKKAEDAEKKAKNEIVRLNTLLEQTEKKAEEKKAGEKATPVKDAAGPTPEDADEIRALKERLNEYESNFFDLQMENMKLKSDMEKLKARK